MTHNVFFWLKDNQNIKLFESEAIKLTLIDSVDRGTLGKTALTPKREVTDKSFTYHLSLSFPDIDAHNAYQDDSIHKDFVSKCKDMWERVIVYDTEDII